MLVLVLVRRLKSVAVAADVAAADAAVASGAESEIWAYPVNRPEDVPMWHNHLSRDFGSHRNVTRLIPVCGLNN